MSSEVQQAKEPLSALIEEKLTIYPRDRSSLHTSQKVTLLPHLDCDFVNSSNKG